MKTPLEEAPILAIDAGVGPETAVTGAPAIGVSSREGVTGMQSKVSDTIASMTAKIRAHTDLPIFAVLMFVLATKMAVTYW